MAFIVKSNTKIDLKLVNKNIYMLTGRGGNIGVSIGKDGVIMIDDQFAPATSEIIKTVKTISDKPIKYLFNTHFHGDHTGGNINFQEKGALIMAHDNVRKHLSQKDSLGLPVITFDNTLTLHLNDDDIIATHVHNAHTDSDAIIYFPNANVLHTGDTFFNQRFPYIDLNNGGSLEGIIKAGELGLMLINTETKIIPGHGNLASYDDYKTYVKMMKTIREAIQKAIDENVSMETIKSTETYTSMYLTDEKAKDDFISGPKFRESVYTSLKNENL